MVSCRNINIFLQEWETPYGIPPFEQIQAKDYIPAVKLGIRMQEAEIDAIIARNDEPTFENTVAAYERSGAVLDKVTGVLFNLSETDATESLQKIVEKVIPMIAEHSDNIFMNPYLFERVDILYRKKDQLGLTREQEMVLDDMHRSFVKNGIALDRESQKRMKKINSTLGKLDYT